MANMNRTVTAAARELLNDDLKSRLKAVEDLARAKPVYRTIPGWKKDITGARKPGDLPAGARKYLDTLSELVGVKAAIASVGPDREQTIFLDRA